MIPSEKRKYSIRDNEAFHHNPQKSSPETGSALWNCERQAVWILVMALHASCSSCIAILFRCLLLLCMVVSLQVVLPGKIIAQPPNPGKFSPAKYDAVEALDQCAIMRDGEGLRIDIFRPQAAGSFPAILLL